MTNGLKVSERGFRGDATSALLLLGTLGFAVAAIFTTLDAVKHRASWLEAELCALGLLCSLLGGAVGRNWIDALRAVLNGLVIAAGYMMVYFIDALIEDRGTRHLPTVAWLAGSVVVLGVALRGLEELPPPPGAADGPN